LESLPLLALSAFMTPLLGTRARSVAGFFGCGCGAAAPARSIPAAILTAAAFGPFAAFARVAAATMVPSRGHEHEFDAAAELEQLVPAAVAAGIVSAVIPHTWFAALPALAAFIAGAAAGTLASPCALGGVALAASLKSTSPFAAYGVLCTSGIIDAWRLRAVRQKKPGDRVTYAALASACAFVALGHGAALLHPNWTVPLAAAAALFALRIRVRAPRNPRAAALAAALVAAAIVGAPVPPIATSATTLSGAYAGERLSFSGIARGRSLARYAITCCRADAQPMVLAIDRAPLAGVWYRASGTLELHRGMLQLHVDRLTAIAPPPDPFVYL
jgi:hypothetical protein